MLQNFLSQKILAEFPFEPTEQQTALIEMLGQFVAATEPEKVFLLKGFAGTGKTSVVSALVRALYALGQKTLLLAPTGRAAKVLAGYSGFTAFTIHKRIYRQKAMGDFRFALADNLYKNTLFIVDEASMIANAGNDTEFGSGRLLDDLVEFVYSGDGCSLLLLGDTAQLPPVNQNISPAMEKSQLEGYGLRVYEFMLTHVVRQALESGILHNATLLRKLLENENIITPCHSREGGNPMKFPKFETQNFSDIHYISGQDLIDEIQRSYDGVGMEDTIVITRSNRRANLYNNGIRARVMQREEEISGGDLLMITKNNYFWNKPYKEIDFIANGDIVEVQRVVKHREMYGFRFATLSLRSLDYGWEIDASVWLDVLQAASPAHAAQMHQTLIERIAEDYPEITAKKILWKKIYENEFFNALQIKFAYAVTCHKAQGGQWKKVFIDAGQVSAEQIDSNFYRWLYTALTRATETVYLVNFEDKARV
ncbi:MAG: AAA family ATPase [Paludibacter sp.]|nr:AAA family ATPase [Paludibacter sp.]